MPDALTTCADCRSTVEAGAGPLCGPCGESAARAAPGLPAPPRRNCPACDGTGFRYSQLTEGYTVACVTCATAGKVVVE